MTEPSSQTVVLTAATGDMECAITEALSFALAPPTQVRIAETMILPVNRF
jgi:hypothetical protein